MTAGCSYLKGYTASHSTRP